MRRIEIVTWPKIAKHAGVSADVLQAAAGKATRELPGNPYTLPVHYVGNRVAVYEDELERWLAAYRQASEERAAQRKRDSASAARTRRQARAASEMERAIEAKALREAEAKELVMREWERLARERGERVTYVSSQGDDLSGVWSRQAESMGLLPNRKG